mmetsp:Transcript_16356/g.32011  ORF Transcript_16356/g.32011 Transcript_16356/m.32011 type:complete len:337 (-) Transcript_16356:14-1024(-)
MNVTVSLLVTVFGQNGAVWIYTHDDNVFGSFSGCNSGGTQFFELASNTSDGTASTSACDQMCDFALGLGPDFCTSLFIVRHPIPWVAVLVEHMSCSVGAFSSKLVVQLLPQLVGFTDVTSFVVPSVLGGSAYDRGTQTFQGILLLLGHFLGHGDHHIVTSDGSSHTEADTSVPRCGFNDDIALLELLAVPTLRVFSTNTLTLFEESGPLFSVQDHPASDAVLDGTSRVHEFTLGEKLAFDSFIPCNVLAAHHWGVPNAVQNAVFDYSEVTFLELRDTVLANVMLRHLCLKFSTRAFLFELLQEWTFAGQLTGGLHDNIKLLRDSRVTHGRFAASIK